ncbi:MAG TPA: hypothetical protein VD994_12125 [Prosthecobacter sp.]|nr:hypothetical protein [Prosthecobacter sp.]
MSTHSARKGMHGINTTLAINHPCSSQALGDHRLKPDSTETWHFLNERLIGLRETGELFI